MKKIILIMMMLVWVLPIVSALEFCQSEIEPNQDCLMVTPTLSCSSVNYTIYDEFGGITEQNTLTLFNDSVYQFTFNEPSGSYLIQLCDGSTREAYVKFDDKMDWLAIIFGIGFMIAGFWLIIILTEKGKTKDEVKNKTLDPIIMYFKYLIIINVLMLGLVPFIISQNPGNVGSFGNIGEWLFTVNIISFALYFFYELVIRKIIYKYIFSLVNNKNGK